MDCIPQVAGHRRGRSAYEALVLAEQHTEALEHTVVVVVVHIGAPAHIVAAVAHTEAAVVAHIVAAVVAHIVAAEALECIGAHIAVVVVAAAAQACTVVAAAVVCSFVAAPDRE